MIKGPVELLALAFEGNEFRGEIIPAIEEVVSNGIVRIIDLVFIRKDNKGSVSIIELNKIDKVISKGFKPLVDIVTGLIGEDDVKKFSEQMTTNSSAAIFLFEHLWAARLSEAVVRAKGRMVADEYIPREVIMGFIEKYSDIKV